MQETRLHPWFYKKCKVLIFSVYFCGARCSYIYKYSCTLQCAVRMWYGCHIRNCDTDESRSLAIALQEEVANRCMLLSPERVKVVNDTFKRQ